MCFHRITINRNIECIEGSSENTLRQKEECVQVEKNSADKLNVEDDPQFTALCVNGDLIYVSTYDGIYLLEAKYDGIGLFGNLHLVWAYEEVYVSSLCFCLSSLFAVSDGGILQYDLVTNVSKLVVSSMHKGLKPVQVRTRQNRVLFTDPHKRQILAYCPATAVTDVFAGNGVEDLIDGPLLQSSFRQPSGIGVEFNNVVYVTDAMSASISMITTKINMIAFQKDLGGLYNAFSTHRRGEHYDIYTLPDACELGSQCKKRLLENQELITQNVDNLPNALNGPQGNVAHKTVESVEFVEWDLSRLIDVTNRYDRYDIKTQNFQLHVIRCRTFSRKRPL